MSVGAISNGLNNFRFASPLQMVSNLKTIALPAITLAASWFMPGVKAADCDYFECWRSCDAHPDAHPIMKLLCQTLCTIFCK